MTKEKIDLAQDAVHAAISAIQESLGDNATEEMVFNVVLNMAMLIITKGGTMTYAQTIENRELLVNSINKYVEVMTRPVSKKKDNIVKFAF